MRQYLIPEIIQITGLEYHFNKNNQDKFLVDWKTIMDFRNVYEDEKRANSYSSLEFPGTYYLAYRDLPNIIKEHVNGRKAMDFGCGTGRSTRFLKRLDFTATGIDISEKMIEKANELDPEGDYRLVENDNMNILPKNSMDLITSIFTFDNIPGRVSKIGIFTSLGRMLKEKGVLINLVSSPEIYVNEWASFTTRDFPENNSAKSGDKVKIVMTDVEDSRPVEDIVFSDEDYRKVYEKSGLDVVRNYKPLGLESEPYEWKKETEIAPWVIYVLKKINKKHRSV